MTPGWTTASRLAWSISRIRFMRVKATVMPPAMPDAPPDRPVPAPRGTMGRPVLRSEAHDRRNLVGCRRAGPPPGSWLLR